ncbi:alpha-glucosidase C-terminal domain-containing protein, partial [Carnobacterium jeotgali]|uniref:alpha-glucosidase C-terminal domain-containing protein n=1 Tax=Carnobacterium jeotgali TaxID=545534 RepID=UPI003C763FAC
LSKDFSRGVMQCNYSNYAGFSSHVPWSGVNREEKYNVADQEAVENSILQYYRAVLKLKQEPVFSEGGFQLLETSLETYCYKRSWDSTTVLVCCNMSDETQVVSLVGLIKQPYTIRLSNEGNTLQEDKLTLSPYGAMVVLL